jgi:ABC-type glycerol-3-phosphate transport system substrate-binding protein
MNLDFLTNIRPFQVIFMTVFGLLAVLGLFLFANFSGFGGGSRLVGNVQIWGTVPQNAVSDALAGLTRNHKEYGNVRYVQKPEATFDAELADAIASGTGPDMVLISQEQLLAESNKLNVIPFSSFPKRTFLDTYVPEATLFLTDKGTYGIPLIVDPIVMYYSKPALASAGVAQPPATWEAVTGLAGTLTQKTSDLQVQKSAIALGEFSNIQSARAIISLLLLQAGSTISAQTGSGGMRSTITSSAQPDATGVSPTEAAMNFYTQFANPSKTVYSWNRSLPDSRQAFLAGDLDLYLGYASERPSIAAGNPNLEFDMAVVPQAQLTQERVTYGRLYALAIPKASKNAAGAYTVARALSTKDISSDFAMALSMAPALRGALTPPADDLYAPVFYPEALISQGWLSPAPQSIDAIFSTMIDNIVTGRKATSEALVAADQALTAALRK